jgi:hypothetical protein
MNTDTRRAIAFIAGSLATDNRVTSIYDYSRGSYTSFSGTVGERIAIYDYDAGCHISGSLPSLFHYGRGAHLSLNVSGDTFKGFDYDTSSHFNGTVRGRSISLYDYGTSAYYNFTV